MDEILSTEGCLTLEDLKGFVDFSDKFIVFGAGPSLKEHVKFLKENYDLKELLKRADEQQYIEKRRYHLERG